MAIRNILNNLLPDFLQANNFSNIICWNSYIRNTTNGHIVLHLFMENALLFFTFSPLCYVQAFFLATRFMSSSPLDMATLALGTSDPLGIAIGIVRP